ncbi:MAG TPA: homoserine kinase [Pyrinomonadaceae bacterium]|jgi:homoserine kinase
MSRRKAQGKLKDVDQSTRPAFEVRVPASTSNLGAGFDCFGLALRLYLTARATFASGSKLPCRVRQTRSEGHSLLPRTAENLIFRAMCLTAERLDQRLPPVRLAVHNEIPLGRGLGSSAAAILAGVRLGAALCDAELSSEALLRIALELEGHADNLAPSLYGGWTIACQRSTEDVLVLRKRWPSEIKVIIISPDVPLETKRARAILPASVSFADAVYNLQRAALLTGALEERAYELVWEAMRDRLHQGRREALVPGLSEALRMPRLPGLLGLALSGAGPSVLALALDHFDEIGAQVADCFHQHEIKTRVRVLEVDDEGMKIRAKGKLGTRRRDNAG